MLMPATSRIALFCVVVLAVLVLSPAVMACPNCKLSVQDQDAATAMGAGVTGASGDMAAGYAYSIYFMLAVPAILLTGLVFFIRRQVREMAVTPE
jgi:hypothetical protein